MIMFLCQVIAARRRRNLLQQIILICTITRRRRLLFLVFSLCALLLSYANEANLLRLSSCRRLPHNRRWWEIVRAYSDKMFKWTLRVSKATFWTVYFGQNWAHFTTAICHRRTYFSWLLTCSVFIPFSKGGLLLNCFTVVARIFESQPFLLSNLMRMHSKKTSLTTFIISI